MSGSTDLAQAIRILAEHVGMSTFARNQIAVALGDQPATPPPPPPDPRDAEIARLRSELGGNKKAAPRKPKSKSKK